MLLRVKFRIKGTKYMTTRIPLEWAIRTRAKDHRTVTRVLCLDERNRERFTFDRFIIEEVNVLDD